MKREDLITLGLTAEHADKVIGQYTEEMKSFVPRSRLDEESAKVTGLATQLTDRDKDIKTLQSAAGKGSDLEKSLAELQGKYKSDTEALQKQLADQRLEAALDAQLTKAKARDPISVKAHLQRDALKLRDDGTVLGLDLDTLIKSKPYLFDAEERHDEGPGFQGGPPPAKVTAQQQLEKQLADAQKAQNMPLQVALKRQLANLTQAKKE